MTDDVLRVQSRLTARDHTLLGWLADHGVLTTFQIAHALFCSLGFAQRRLLTLYRVGLVDRFRPNKFDGGSYPYHYVLGLLGAEVVAAQRGDDPPRRSRIQARRRALTARTNLDHLLGLNQFFTDLAGHARTHPPASLDRWWPETRCNEPWAFGTVGDLGSRIVRPDGHGIWTEPGPDGRTLLVPFFLEHDTGAEPLGQLIDKLGAYRRLATAGGPRWPVLFWLHSTRRQTNLHARLREVGTPFPVATAARDYAAELRLSPAERVWHLADSVTEPIRLAQFAELFRLPPPAT
ncbi:replication-relaxation family protein [Cryptosporangium japonicum]|uniref:replication-relaxation family protein n=1 Tax=Cryptosporangium japonicum TaxID=80872 RepID=UPI0031D7EC6B